MLSFIPITVADMPIIWQYLCKERGRTTDFSFGGVAMWIDYFSYQYCIYEQTLFIKGVLEDNRDVPAFSLPIGNMELSKAIDLVKQYCNMRNIKPRFSAIPEYALLDFKCLNPVDVSELVDWGDYIYEADLLATLAGKKMAKKRNHFNRFCSIYEDRFKIVDITPSNITELFRFLDFLENCSQMDANGREEFKLTRKYLEKYESFSSYIIGAILLVDNSVCAFTIGDIKGDTLYIHIEKADRNVPGSYEAINTLFVRSIQSQYPNIKYVNREDDAGDAGLRKAKLSYKPIDILKKFNIYF